MGELGKRLASTFDVAAAGSHVQRPLMINPTRGRLIAAHCRANIVVVEDDVQLQKILKIRSELPGTSFND